MLIRIAALVVLVLALRAQPAHAQHTVVDANATLVGNIVSYASDVFPPPTLVTTQDASGIWIAMKVMQDGFVSTDVADSATAYYADPACETTPYLAVSLGTPLTPLIRKVVTASQPGQLFTQAYYPGNPVAIVTVHSSRSLASTTCRTLTADLWAGPMVTLDLSTFVAPFSVQ